MRLVDKILSLKGETGMREEIQMEREKGRKKRGRV
jgi:hypothetical protein